MSQAIDDPMAGRYPAGGYSPAANPPAKPKIDASDITRGANEAFCIPEHLKQDSAATPDLNGAVADVLAEVDWVQKRGENKFHKYLYATADDLREHVAKLLGRHGLSYEQHEVGFSSLGALIVVSYVFRLNHKSGQRGPFERVTALAMALTSNGSSDDKAISKAHTLALKDWVKSRFSIPTGDDPEPAGSDDPDADDANHSIQNRAKSAQQTAPKGDAMDRVAERIGANAAPTMRQEAADIERKQKQKAAEDYLKSLKEAITNAASHDDDTLEKVVGNADAQRKMSNLEKYPELHRELVAHCAQEKIVGKIGFLQSANSALYDKIITASQSKAA